VLQITAQMRILVAVDAVDGRKGIDSLVQLCREKLAADPFSGCLFIFRSRSATTIRVLTYDGQGFWLAQKRLSNSSAIKNELNTKTASTPSDLVAMPGQYTLKSPGTVGAYGISTHRRFPRGDRDFCPSYRQISGPWVSVFWNLAVCAVRFSTLPRPDSSGRLGR
jgi:IS66 Orf2 like protein